ncbi:PPC domain-containing protein [Singulisphaera sp. PoT]|uniref:PPC domain-containing protein n=1 Tax=Singulisphaera sp. PoT TaxID=3411797 RepID=UPI003BF48CD6
MATFRRSLGVVVSLFIATQAFAASPNMASLRPQGGQRGTEVVVTLGGARLADAKELMFYQPGITTTKLEVVNDGAVKATLKIAPDCPLGLHDLRLRTATGISELRSFSVGALKEVNEVEPNNEFASPQPITMNTTVNGVADNEDADYYVVEAKKGERISAEVEGVRLGITHFDPYVAILDSKRFELASSDDSALVWQDGAASAIAPADGKYMILVRESAYAGNGACLYRVHVGNFPRPTATIPSGGKLNETVDVKWVGDVAGETTTKVTLPASPRRDFGVIAQDALGSAPHPNMFRLSPFGNVIEVEPNDNHPTATVFTPPMALNGVIGKKGDTDHFVFKATKGQTFDIKVFARSLRSPLDPVLYVGPRNGGATAGSDDSAGPDSYIRFGVPADGEYFISLVDQLQNGGPDYAYRIEVTPVEPKLALSVTSEATPRGTGAIAVAVPRKNRQAILVNASRADFGGELIIESNNLPPGVAMEADTMSANIGTFPVLFTATADAPLAGTLAGFSAKHTDPNVKFPVEFSHPIEMVLSLNNANLAYWTRTVDKVAVGVTDEAPFSIDIVEPKVPLVRGGQMNLKVVATRKPGFTGPIAVSLPWNPPGVGSAGGVVIPENQNEALIPMNADGGAELRTWKIVVNGTGTGPTGPVMVSTQLAKLTVAVPFVGLAYQAASVEQGKEVDMAIKVAKAVDFPGEATVVLYGLPNKVTTENKKITKDTTDLVFHIKTDAASPAGNHASLFCQVIITQNNEPIIHNIGTGQLRIDVPIPPKANAPAPAPMPVAAAPAPPAAAPAKPLSRLEKLRLEAQERAKAGK